MGETGHHAGASPVGIPAIWWRFAMSGHPKSPMSSSKRDNPAPWTTPREIKGGTSQPGHSDCAFPWPAGIRPIDRREFVRPPFVCRKNTQANSPQFAKCQENVTLCLWLQVLNLYWLRENFLRQAGRNCGPNSISPCLRGGRGISDHVIFQYCLVPPSIHLCMIESIPASNNNISLALSAAGFRFVPRH